MRILIVATTSSLIIEASLFATGLFTFTPKFTLVLLVLFPAVTVR